MTTHIESRSRSAFWPLGILAILILAAASAGASPASPLPRGAKTVQVRLMPLDFTISNQLPANSQLWYGWQLTSWSDWLKRPSSGPLIVPMPNGHPPLDVFEARFAAVLSSPVTKFNQNYLLNLATIQRLDPYNLHQRIANGSAFTVLTDIPFPDRWVPLIRAAKMAKLMSAKSADHLELTSDFAYLDANQIEQNPLLQKFVGLLNVTSMNPTAVDIQSIVHINQMAQFGSFITFFYRLTDRQTLMVNYFVLAIKKKDLNMGVHFGGLDFTGRSVILGNNPELNTPSGIGAGLPKFAETMFINMYSGLQN